MPWMLLIGLVLAVIAGLAQLARTRARGDAEILLATGVVRAVAGGLASLLLILSCFTIVSTRNVGIVTQFGKPVATRSNGLHLIWPWQKVHELNGTIQTDSQTGGFDSGRCSGGTPVRLANQSTACVDNTIRWRILEKAGDDLYRDYLKDSNIRDSLVTRELNAALNVEFAKYNPLDPKTAAPQTPVDPKTAADPEVPFDPADQSLPALSARVTKALRAKIGSQIEILNVIISIVHFDEVTQDRINALQAQIANTRVADEAKNTALKQAEANRALAASVSNDPNVLVARCLDLVNSGKPLPAGFQCWPGTGGVPVTIPAR